METSDKVFWKVVKQCNYLLELKSEIGLLTERLVAKGRARSGSVVPESDDVALENISETDPDMLQLVDFKRQEREVAGRLEKSFLELAELEIATFSDSPSAEELLEQSTYTVRSVVKHSMDKWNAVLGWNNNVADLLVHSSKHPGDDIASEELQPSSRSTRVTILSDEANEQVFGVRINDQEVRFVDKKQGNEHFRNTVLSAVESWSTGRLEELDQLRDRAPCRRNASPATSA